MTGSGPSAAFVSLVRAVATDLLGRKDELNRLDGFAGDGDFGVTMSIAAEAVIDLLPSLDEQPLAGPREAEDCDE